MTDEQWRIPWLRAARAVREDYGAQIGRSTAQLPTPALVLDLDVAERNIATMAAALADGPARLRPHTKVQKSPDLARRQLQAGAIGLTVATVWEAAAMAAAGMRDILIANQVVGPDKVAALAALAGHAELTVVVDDARNVADLSAALATAGHRADVLVDLDVGMGRCGARSGEQALQLARAVADADRLRLRGVQAYEGHCMLEPDEAVRRRAAAAAMDYATAVAGTIRAEFPSATTLSSGGTGTYHLTGRHPGVTELQAGSYVFMDAFHGSLVPGFEVSLGVLSTVLARHQHTIVLDAGRKSVGIDFVSPPIRGFDYVARYYAEEHALFDVDSRLVAQAGDRLMLTCGYAPTTVNLHDLYYVVQGDRVVDVWPVFPRGASHHGFLPALLGTGR